MISTGLVASCLALLAPAQGFVTPIISRFSGGEVRTTFFLHGAAVLLTRTHLLSAVVSRRPDRSSVPPLLPGLGRMSPRSIDEMHCLMCLSRVSLTSALPERLSAKASVGTCLCLWLL